MIGKTVRIRTAERYPQRHATDKIEFTDGVNIIYGEPNTGKSKWLAIIDFLLGDNDPAKQSLGDLAELYDSAAMTLVIGDVEHKIERNWKKRGLAEKIVIDERAIDGALFSDFILEKLALPALKFPQGSGRWRDISWRILMRHIYRHEDQWDDIAPKQFDSEQHACLMTFLGFAPYLFPEERGRLADKEAERGRLEAKKETFEESLNAIAKEILSAQEMGVSVTEKSIDDAIVRLQTEIETLSMQKDDMLETILSDNADPQRSQNLIITQDWARYREERELLFADYQSTKSRISELSDHQALLQSELERFKRAQVAGNLLGGIKVTHCPICDQEVEQQNIDPDHCPLCRRTYQPPSLDGGVMRIQLEQQQIQEEVKEVAELLGTLEVQERANLTALREIDEKVADLETRLRPLRRAAAAIQIPEIAVIDQEIGRKSEQIRQWQRILSLLDMQQELISKIDEISKEAKQLEADIALSESFVSFEETAHLFGESMNDYLNKIHASRSSRWSSDNHVSVALREKSFAFRIRSMSWKAALGGTWKGYFLLAYHYALMAFSENYYFPGLLMLDFPKSFEGSAKDIFENANHTVQPFIDLSELFPAMQAIFAGKGFSPIDGANFIEFSHQWVSQ